jgi:hypothetical protein
MSDNAVLPPGRLDVISAARYGTEGYPRISPSKTRPANPCYCGPTMMCCGTTRTRVYRALLKPQAEG